MRGNPCSQHLRSLLLPIPTQKLLSCTTRLFDYNPILDFVSASVRTHTHKLIPKKKSVKRMGVIMQLLLCNCRLGHAAQSPTTTITTRRAPGLRHTLCAVNLHRMLLVCLPFSTPLYICLSCSGCDSCSPPSSLSSFLSDFCPKAHLCSSIERWHQPSVSLTSWLDKQQSCRLLEVFWRTGYEYQDCTTGKPYWKPE